MKKLVLLLVFGVCLALCLSCLYGLVATYSAWNSFWGIDAFPITVESPWMKPANQLSWIERSCVNQDGALSLFILFLCGGIPSCAGACASFSCLKGGLAHS